MAAAEEVAPAPPAPAEARWVPAVPLARASATSAWMTRPSGPVPTIPARAAGRAQRCIMGQPGEAGSVWAFSGSRAVMPYGPKQMAQRGEHGRGFASGIHQSAD